MKFNSHNKCNIIVILFCRIIYINCNKSYILFFNKSYSFVTFNLININDNNTQLLYLGYLFLFFLIKLTVTSFNNSIKLKN